MIEWHSISDDKFLLQNFIELVAVEIILINDVCWMVGMHIEHVNYWYIGDHLIVLVVLVNLLGKNKFE